MSVEVKLNKKRELFVVFIFTYYKTAVLIYKRANNLLFHIHTSKIFSYRKSTCHNNAKLIALL